MKGFCIIHVFLANFVQYFTKVVLIHNNKRISEVFNAWENHFGTLLQGKFDMPSIKNSFY